MPPYRRPVNTVFQHYALFPHMDVARNVGYGLRQRRPAPDRQEQKRRIEEASRYVPMERLALSTQCGFASTEEGNLVTPMDQEAKLRLVAETAREMWGDS